MNAHPLDWIADQLAQWDAAHLRRHLVDRDNPQSATACFNGEELINFGANDYLGLANDARIIQAVASAMETYGWGSGASPLITGHSALHRELERELADFEGTEASVLFPTGFAANAGAISALAKPHRPDSPYGPTILFSDARNHASIIDGCRLSGAPVHIYRHNDPDHLAALLQASPQTARKIIVTDTLFSMDGDLAPLADLLRLAESESALLIVDEAHATGVLGPTGRGACERMAIDSPNLVRIGTFSKALGSLGGFVAGDRRIIDWIINTSRTLIYSTAAPAAMCAAGLTALDIVRTEPVRRESLLHQSTALRLQLRSKGWKCGEETTQIIPVRIGDPERTMTLSAQLREQGLLVPGIRPPSVPTGESLLRISLSHDHQPAMIQRLVNALGSAGDSD